MKKLSTLILLSMGASVFATSGCALIIGTETRVEADSDLGPIDKETEIPTSDLCIDYCNEVMGNCTKARAVYKARASCINTCNALPPGEPAEPADNTVECRLQQAKNAEDDPDEFCVAAGPGGGTSCGSNCEAWCQLLEVECESEFEKMVDCRATCKSIDDDGSFDVTASYSKDDIQCRLIHLGAVGGQEDSLHCGHARYIAEDKCVPEEDAEPSCATYCDTVMVNCQDAATYQSKADCMAACEVFPLGNLKDRNENSIGCRIYHAQAAAFGVNPHCPHSGPTGDGTCGAGSDGGASGNCESYCRLLEEGCSDEFSSEFSDIASCVESCREDFEDQGAEKNSGYSIATATAEDSLQCRVFYAVRALADDANACDKARPGGRCAQS